ncbi:hypothetical protein [Candidatus Poriferisodalis sp.]|uniref:hypothetical protein n=1 Tax=Candidatus Poriferisodalis sp. TaxID=3101277 RepID=UPI003B59BDE7
MIVTVIVISLVIGFVVAAGVVGTQAQRLGRQRREPVWRLAEAAEFVSDLLPFDIAASLDADELEALLRQHLNQLQFGSAESAGVAAGDTDGTASDASTTITEDRSSAADLYRSVRRDGLEVTLEQVYAVVDAHLEYLRRIGALAAVSPNGR